MTLLAYVGVILPSGGPKMAQDHSMLAQVGLKMLKMASQGLHKANLGRFFGQKFLILDHPGPSKLKKTVVDGSVCILRFFGSLNAVWASKLAPDGLLERIWDQVDPSWLQVGSGWVKLGPSWLQVGSSWSHVGPKLATTWLKLVPCWAQIRVPSRP